MDLVWLGLRVDDWSLLSAQDTLPSRQKAKKSPEAQTYVVDILV